MKLSNKRTLLIVLLSLGLLLATTAVALADKPTGLDNNGNGKDFVTEMGFDSWGYNYVAHMFSGGYCDAYHNAAWCQAYVDVDLIMKWNEAWLSGSDLDGDDALDRHFGHDSYIGSGAWLTNHMSGEDGGVKWVYFVKIVAMDTANQDCTATGGYEIWADFCAIEEIYNEQGGPHGVALLSQSPGFGPQN